jgi:CRISPR-associated protein Csd2
MEVLKVLWWKHGSRAGKYSSAKVHASLQMNEDGSGSYTLGQLDGLTPEEIPGF